MGVGGVQLRKRSDGFSKNDDGSYDVYFGPEAPKGKESNWLQTVPRKGWFTILRMYGPLEPWLDKKWRPGEIEPTGEVPTRVNTPLATSMSMQGVELT